MARLPCRRSAPACPAQPSSNDMIRDDLLYPERDMGSREGQPPPRYPLKNSGSPPVSRGTGPATMRRMPSIVAAAGRPGLAGPLAQAVLAACLDDPIGGGEPSSADGLHVANLGQGSRREPMGPLGWGARQERSVQVRCRAAGARHRHSRAPAAAGTARRSASAPGSSTNPEGLSSGFEVLRRLRLGHGTCSAAAIRKHTAGCNRLRSVPIKASPWPAGALRQSGIARSWHVRSSSWRCSADTRGRASEVAPSWCVAARLAIVAGAGLPAGDVEDLDPFVVEDRAAEIVQGPIGRLVGGDANNLQRVGGMTGRGDTPVLNPRATARPTLVEGAGLGGVRGARPRHLRVGLLQQIATVEVGGVAEDGHVVVEQRLGAPTEEPQRQPDPGLAAAGLVGGDQEGEVGGVGEATTAVGPRCRRHREGPAVAAAGLRPLSKPGTKRSW